MWLAARKSPIVQSRSPPRKASPDRSRTACGRAAGSSARAILAVGMSSRTCWNAQLLNGGSCQFASVTWACLGNGGAPDISSAITGPPSQGRHHRAGRRSGVPYQPYRSSCAAAMPNTVTSS